MRKEILEREAKRPVPDGPLFPLSGTYPYLHNRAYMIVHTNWLKIFRARFVFLFYEMLININATLYLHVHVRFLTIEIVYLDREEE